LTARVIVNRVWQGHFGKGLAENTNNFGKMGKKPSHPELLDWLASEFIGSGWRIKALHRTIMLSAAYRRASRHKDSGLLAQKDPENRYLSVFTPRRLEAEALRDSMLVVSGELSDSAGGPGTFPNINREAAEQPRHAMGSVMPAYYVSPEKRDRNRRSVYGFQQRSLVDPMIEVFNGPPLDLSCERRDATTVPTQAFALFNSEVSYELALALAQRAAKDAADRDSRVARMYALALQRQPSAKERAIVRDHIAHMEAFHRDNPPAPRKKREPLVRSITSELTGENFRFEEPAPPWQVEESTHASELPADVRALADLALVLFNSNEFVYVY
jgi:hypothetical protein